MTDNEVIFAFVNGCDLLKSDNVAMADMHDIRKCLDDCAKKLIPFVHKYVTCKDCLKCKHNKSKNVNYTECKYMQWCRETVDRRYYEKRK